MNKAHKTILTFFLFFIFFGINSFLSILIYSSVKDNTRIYISIIILAFVMLCASFCILFDIVIRRIIVDKDAKEIRYATKRMTNGDFKINLIPSHTYKAYTAYDYIKDDLNTLALELSKNEVLKNDFISNVSHEIKTPLAVINNYAKALEDNKLTAEERNKYIKALQDASGKLSNLVTNILKLNKLENQSISPKYEKFNLSESVEEAILQFEELLERKNITLNCEIDDNIVFNSEESYLNIIWNNLISNAIKFTEENGTINITLKKTQKGIIFIIKDSGCGISKETGKYIFEKFYQGDTSHSKEGNGLGLALVKRVIDSLGGSINVESEVGIGSTFTVELKEIEYVR